MQQKPLYRHCVITDCTSQNPDFQTLFSIFRQTLKPDMRFIEFKAYYASAKLAYIDVTFILFGETIIGFCAAAFYNTVIQSKQYTIGRAAVGVLENHRGHQLPKWTLYKKYIRFWMKHPFRYFILSAYVANPLIYAMICKYTGMAYPVPTCAPPAAIVDLKNALLESQHLRSEESQNFVVEIHFCVEIKESDIKRIFSSKDKAVHYFLTINPRFRQQYGVIVIIPVNLKNILLSSLKFGYHKSFQWLKTLIENIQNITYSRSEKINFN